MLHLLAGAERISAGALLTIFPEFQVPHDPGQGTVGDTMPLALEDLPDPDGVALRGGEGLTDGGREVLIPRPPLHRLPRPPDHLLDGVPGDFQDPADLPDMYAPLVKA